MEHLKPPRMRSQLDAALRNADHLGPADKGAIALARAASARRPASPVGPGTTTTPTRPLARARRPRNPDKEGRRGLPELPHARRADHLRWNLAPGRV